MAQATIQPLIQSRDGLHLTAYIRDPKHVEAARMQIRRFRAQATDLLEPVLNPDEIKRFLLPLERLEKQTHVLKNMVKGNVGLFRTWDSFRILSLPIEVDPVCVVADSFHVKPLLKWMHADRPFFVIGKEGSDLHLYRGTQTTFEHLETAEFLRHGSMSDKKFAETVSDWIKNWSPNSINTYTPYLFFAGERTLASRMKKRIKALSVIVGPEWPHFDRELALQICSEVRMLIQHETRKELTSAIMEYEWASERKMAKKNIFLIAKDAIRGRVKKLLVADGVRIFGKLDRKSGGITMHVEEMDHQDDDLLDDLAQTVLANGGEVLVVDKSQMPNRRPIAAILKDESPVEISPAKELKL